MSLPSSTAFVYKGVIVDRSEYDWIFREGYAACFPPRQQPVRIFDLSGATNTIMTSVTERPPPNAKALEAKVRTFPDPGHDKTLVHLCRIWQYVSNL